MPFLQAVWPPCCRLVTAVGRAPSGAGESPPRVLSTRAPSRPAPWPLSFFSRSLHLGSLRRALPGLGGCVALGSLFVSTVCPSVPLLDSQLAVDAEGDPASRGSELPGLSGAVLAHGGGLPTVLRNCRVFNFRGAREH